MQFFDAPKKEIITIHFLPHKTTYSHLIKAQDAITFQTTLEINTELDRKNLVIFNHAKIINDINAFIQKNNIQNPSILIALSDTSLNEYIIPHEIDKAQEKSNQLHAWDYQELKTKNNIYHFWCGIPQPILFQYKLLTLKTGFNCSIITSGNAGIFKALSHQNTLQDIDNTQSIEKIIEDELEHYNDIFNIMYNEKPKEKKELLTALGLYIMEQE